MKWLRKKIRSLIFGKCPKCGSPDIYRLPYALLLDKCRCADCGNIWDD